MKIVQNYDEKEEAKRKAKKKKKIIITSLIVFIAFILIFSILYYSAINRNETNEVYSEEEFDVNPDLDFLGMDKEEKEEIENMSKEFLIKKVMTEIIESKSKPITIKKDILRNLNYIKESVDKGYDLKRIKEYYTDEDYEYYIKYTDILNFVHAVNYMFEGANANSEDPAYFFTGIAKEAYLGENISAMNYELSAKDSINPYNTSDFIYYARLMVEDYVNGVRRSSIGANGMYKQMIGLTVSEFVNSTNRDKDINEMAITTGIIEVLKHKVKIEDLSNYEITIPIFTTAYEYAQGKESKFIIPMYNKKDKKFLIGIFDENEKIVNVEVVKERS